nr:integrase, catalytic region, zinc finger, CCHC-type, peptidase aspartic, catalytic [Tanacetum cinerariifolium]
MDSIIPLGQKNTLAEYMILSGADNRPPMLDKGLLPPEWSKFVTDVKLVKDLHTTNFDQLHAYLEQHELHENEVRLLHERNEDPLAFSQMNHQTSSVPQIVYQSPQVSTQPITESRLVDSGFAVMVFSLGDDPIAYLNKAMAFLTAVASLRFPSTNNQLRTSSNPRSNKFRGDNGKVIMPKRPRNEAWYKDKAMLAEAQEARNFLDKEKLVFLADPGVPDGQDAHKIIPNNVAFQTKDLDTYDSHCDDISNAKTVLMANISNYGSDVMLEAQQDSMILSVIEQMSEQMINYVNNWKKINKEQNNESITDELERYKERVKTFEQRLNIDLSSREKMIDSKMDDMIKEKLALKEPVDSLEQNLSKQIKEKESLLQTFTVFKNKSKENKYMENKIDLEKKLKELDNIIFKVGQSAQIVHMLTKPQNFYDNIHKQALETLILEEVSRSKMSEKEKDPEAIKQKKSHKPIDYVKLNKLYEDFGKRFVPQQELSTDEAFWYHMVNSSTKSSDALRVKIEAFKELPKELLVYVRDTCPDSIKLSAKKVATTPKNNVKKVRFAEPLTSSSNIKQVESSKTSYSNTYVLSLTRLKCSISNCESTPTCNKKNDTISQTPSMNMKNKVEAQPRKVNTKNHVVEPIRGVNVKQSQLNATTKLICATCKKFMFNGVHDMCLLDFVENVNSHAKSAKKHKKQKIWKPTGHVLTKVGFKWKPTGRTFTIVELKVYSRKPKTVKKVGSSEKAKIIESKNANHSEPNKAWGSNATDIPSSSSLVMTVGFRNDHIARIMGYGDYQLGNVTISRVYYVEGLRHNLFSVGQFCDADLEVAFRKNTCFIRNLEGVDLLSGSRDTNLYIISLNDMLKTSPICCLSKASKTKSWLWHRWLSHLNCGTLNKLAKDGLARGIPRLKFRKIIYAEAINTACYTQNCSLIHLRYNKTSYELMQDKKPDLSFFHVFGSLCYPTNDTDDLGKLDAKADIGAVDPTLFTWKAGNGLLLVQIYVNDIIFASTNTAMYNEFANLMTTKFKMSMMRKMSFFLGLQISHSPKGIFLNQSKYASKIIKKYSMFTSDSVDTPMVEKSKLDEDLQRKLVDATLYRSMIGSLMYLTSNRPTLIYAVCLCAIMSSISAQQAKLDLELVPKEKRLDILKCNRRLNPRKIQKEPTFQVVLDALALTLCYSTFLITTDVLEVYMHQFWDYVYKHDTIYKFKMDKRKRFKLTLEIFRDIMKICPRVQGQDFDALHYDEEIMSFLREFGHNEEINSLNDSLRDFYKTHPSGSGTVTKTAPSVAKIKPSVTNEETGVKPGVLDVTEEESSESEEESWGNDEDDSNKEQDSRNEGSDEENDSDDDNTQSNSEKGSDSEHETDENESNSESDQEENEEEI